MASSFYRLASCAFRPLPSFTSCTFSGSSKYLSTLTCTRPSLINSHKSSLPSLPSFLVRHASTSNPRISIPGATEDGFIPIYRSAFPKKHWLVRGYGMVFCLIFLQAGYFFYDAFSNDPNTSTPLKPIMGLLGPSMMAAMAIRVGFSHAKKLLFSLHYNPVSQKVKLTYPSKKTELFDKKEVYTTVRALSGTLLERNTNIFSLNPSKTRLKKSIPISVGKNVYVLERNGIYSGDGKLLDLYFYSPGK